MSRVLVVLVMTTIGLSAAQAQVFSPGDLAQPHAPYEGLSNCSRCHDGAQRLSPAKCFDCHGEIGARFEKKSGYHGRMQAPKREACAQCHHDHQGKTFEMIEWEPSKEKFPHDETGYKLEGKHQKVKCDECHATPFIVAPDVKAKQAKIAGWKTYLGAATACTGCHADEHRGQLNTKCETCHDAKDWAPARGFDRKSADFPLLGKHKQVACEKCHDTERDSAPHPAEPKLVHADRFVRYEPVDFQSCTSCHKDVHQGRFGQKCESCHTNDGWKIMKKDAREREFHQKTKFPLDGAHATVACNDCHGPFGTVTAKFKGLPHKTCMACHDDSHGGQLKPADCERCHTTSAFSPATYELEDHQTYPLVGGHAAVGCNRCHTDNAKLANKDKKPSGPGHVLTPSPIALHFGKNADKCESCHKDRHDGEFKSAAKGCATCHDTTTFSAVRFDHDKSDFPLRGKHEKAACRACHRPEKTVFRLDAAPKICASCHTDVHLGQFAKTGCDRCHDNRAFEPSIFDHDSAEFCRFPLEGAHASTKCASCHPKRQVDAATSVVRYRPTPATCSACHKDPHRGEYEGLRP